MRRPARDKPVRLSATGAAWWLAAFIDGEGCIYHRRKRSTQVVTITVCDKELIDFAARCFDRLDIEYRRCSRKGATKSGRKRWTIEVAKAESFKKAQRLIPIQCRRKQEKFSEAVSLLVPMRCGACGCLRSQRSVGCEACIARHKYRRRREREGFRVRGLSIAGRTGRPARGSARVLRPATL